MLDPVSCTNTIILEISRCSPNKLNFNGAYNCSGDGVKSWCVLSCPPGVDFSSPPQPHYVCHYQHGVFQPQPVPTCLIPSNMKIINSNKRSASSYQTTAFSSVNWSSVIFGISKIETDSDRLFSCQQPFASQYSVIEVTNHPMFRPTE